MDRNLSSACCNKHKWSLGHPVGISSFSTPVRSALCPKLARLVSLPGLCLRYAASATMKCLCSDVRNALGRTRGTFQLCRTVHIHLCPDPMLLPLLVFFPAPEIRHQWAWMISPCDTKSCATTWKRFDFDTFAQFFSSFSGLTFSWRRLRSNRPNGKCETRVVVTHLPDSRTYIL